MTPLQVVMVSLGLVFTGASGWIVARLTPWWSEDRYLERRPYWRLDRFSAADDTGMYRGCGSSFAAAASELANWSFARYTMAGVAFVIGLVLCYQGWPKPDILLEVSNGYDSAGSDVLMLFSPLFWTIASAWAAGYVVSIVLANLGRK